MDSNEACGIEATKKRLAKEREEYEAFELEVARREGRAWAEQSASYQELKGLDELRKQQEITSFTEFFGQNFWAHDSGWTLILEFCDFDDDVRQLMPELKLPPSDEALGTFFDAALDVFAECVAY